MISFYYKTFSAFFNTVDIPKNRTENIPVWNFLHHHPKRSSVFISFELRKVFLLDRLKPALLFEGSRAQVRQDFDQPRWAAFLHQRKPAYEPCEVPLRQLSGNISKVIFFSVIETENWSSFFFAEEIREGENIWLLGSRTLTPTA